jgi:hypothetical protein
VQPSRGGGVVDAVAVERRFRAPQVVEPFAPDREELYIQTLRLGLARAFFGKPQQIRVVAAAKPAIGGDHDDKYRTLRILGRRGRFGSGQEQRVGDAFERVVIRPRVEQRFLRAPQPRRRHQLHRTRDLLGRTDRRDAPANCLKCRHPSVAR